MLKAVTSNAALSAAETCRKAAIQVLTEAPIDSDPYRRAAELIGAIDALAAALTGREDIFHSRPHSVG
jgi:hypothetical protein